MFLAILFTTIFPFALNANPIILPREQSDPSTVGIHWAKNISFGGCTADQQKVVLTAIDDAFQLATSAIGALAASEKNPATFFFPSSFAKNAIDVFTTTQYALKPGLHQWYTNLNDIELYCEDIKNLCDTPAPGNAPGQTTARLGYVPQETNAAPGFGGAEIVVCPALLALPRNPPPCSGSPGLASLGWGFLRTVLALRSVQPGYPKLAARSIYDAAPGLQQSHELVTKKSGYDQNVDNFAELATWSWDLGMNSDGKMQCPDECANMGEGVTC